MITLPQYQQIEQVNQQDLPDLDKALFAVCILYNMTEYEVDNASPVKVLKLMNGVASMLESFRPKVYKKVGRYFMEYDISKMTFGQYIELAFFLAEETRYAHYIMATISKRWGRKRNDHRRKADYFATLPAEKVMGCVRFIKQRFEEFNKEYKTLFGADKEVAGDVDSSRFMKRFGWIYSATQVRDYERITMNQTFELPVRQALNDLVFLKAKGKYETEQIKKAK